MHALELQSRDSYRHAHFQRAQLSRADAAFGGGGAPGGLFPDFELTDIVGNKVRLDHLLGLPTVIIAVSVTCPMAASAMPVLRRLDESYGSRARIVLLYVREAHPGESFPQPETMTEKRLHAREFRERDAVPWLVLVDDLDGTVHRALDFKPNAAVFLDADGTVVYRSLWANDRRAMQRGFETLLDRAQEPGQRQSHLVPMLTGLGTMHEVISEAGPQARRDMLREAAPLYALARVAGLFKPLSPLGRGIAATVATGGVGLLLAVGARRALRRRRTMRPVVP